MAEVNAVTLRKRVQMNGRNYRVTGAMRQVLEAVVDAEPARPAWGFGIGESTGLGPESVYPVLDQLMKLGLIDDAWEFPAPEGRPARRFYYPSYDPSWYRANGLLEGSQP